MEFYSVYKIDTNDGQHDHVFFMSFDKALAYRTEWAEKEPWNTILLCYECTED